MGFYNRTIAFLAIGLLIFLGNTMLAPAESNTTKRPITGNVAVHYLELLSTRIWLSHWSKGNFSDIPRFISRDHLCPSLEMATRSNGWTALCLPVKAELIMSPGDAIVQISFSPDVNAELVLRDLRQVLSTGSLSVFAINETQFSELRKYFYNLVSSNPTLQNAYENGRIDLDGKTYPLLEQLFGFKTPNANEIIKAMQKLVSFKSEVTIADNLVTTMIFYPDKTFFNNTLGENNPSNTPNFFTNPLEKNSVKSHCHEKYPR